MCVVSMVGDHYGKTWKDYQQPQVFPDLTPYKPLPDPAVTKKEFDDLKREVLEMKELLKNALKIDEKLGTPDCETEEKIALLRKIAEHCGVSLDDVFQKK
jgi:hypothetical protein